MHLYIKENQRDDGWLQSSIVFELTLQLELTEEEHHLFQKYGLGDTIVYMSQAREDHNQALTEHHDEAQKKFEEAPLLTPTLEELGKSLSLIGEGISNLFSSAYHAIAGQFTVQITIGSLIEGHYLESESVEELTSITLAVIASMESAADLLKLSLSFDGSDRIHEP